MGERVSESRSEFVLRFVEDEKLQVFAEAQGLMAMCKRLIL